MNPVLFDTLICTDGRLLAVATLNGEARLNALDLPMIRALHAQLDLWSQDQRIACVILRGAGNKAFCAGGDVRSLRAALIENPQPCPHPLASSYFAEEYALDYCIHTFAKPLIVWGHGIVMGGGLGLLVGASHRILTPASRIAMPEITIGLYPDVGASWFLPRLPARLGLFLALSGVGLNAVDALHANLADHILAQDAYPALLEGLAALHWRADPRQHHEQISALISAMETDVPLPGQLMRHFDTLRRMMQHGSLDQVCDGILQADFDDPWLQQAQRGLAQGCPTTAALSWEIFRRSQGLSLAQALRMELILSVNICARPDFSEGVRALLVDKDRQPRWCRQREQIDHDWIDSHFISPWSAAQHPLAQLGNTP